MLRLSGKPNPQVTFIPSSSYESEIDFQDFIDSFRKYSVYRFLHFAIDTNFDLVLYQEAFRSDIIFLDGGNTFYFLQTIREKGLMKDLKKFAEKGGVLAGLSAGAILMTPNITTASFPSFDRDDNLDGIKNLKAMNLADFEFYPHYSNSKRYADAMIKYSKKLKYPLYACPNGSGIAIDGDRTEFIGRVYGFLKGQRFMVNP